MTDNPIIRAARFAADAHAGQTRKYTGRPYVTHLARVAGRACIIPDVPEDVVAAGWLHDYLEDCRPYEDWMAAAHSIGHAFGSDVEALVWALTNDSKHVLPAHDSRAARKAHDHARLADAPYWAKMLKLIDRADNLREMAAAPLKFRTLYVAESHHLLEVLAGVDPVLERELVDAMEGRP